MLHEWRSGDTAALDRLVPLVYRRLKGIAGRAMRTENSGHTLQPTALVNEAFLRLFRGDVDWKDRAHFYAVAARQMRHILIDSAKARRRAKRGGGENITLDFDPEAQGSFVDVLALNELLEQMRSFDERKFQVFELSFFGGLSQEEIAEALQLSTATVFRDLRLAKAWMRNNLRNREGGQPA